LCSRWAHTGRLRESAGTGAGRSALPPAHDGGEATLRACHGESPPRPGPAAAPDATRHVNKI